jgi:hypothetical protein
MLYLVCNYLFTYLIAGQTKPKKKAQTGQDRSDKTKSVTVSSTSSKATKESRLEYLNKLARGEISGSSSDENLSGNEDYDEDDSNSSSDSSDSDSGNSSDNEMEHGPLAIPGDEDIPTMEDATHRIALQNCDWNSIKAEDILYVF